MESILSYPLLTESLSYIFYPKYKSTGSTVHMIGMLFTRPTSKLGRSEILPNRDYWHIRSGKNIYFFWVGYDSMWMFYTECFHEFVKTFESKTTWKYSGGSDLILLNALFDPQSICKQNPCGNWRLDFNSAVLCQLDSMIKDGTILSIEIFFQDIFRFAEEHPGGEATWGFSDHKGIAAAGTALKQVVLSLLPLETGRDIQRVAHFAIVDIGK